MRRELRWVTSSRGFRSLPQFLGNPHGVFSALGVFHLAALIDQLLRTGVIAAGDALALLTANHTSLKALRGKRATKCLLVERKLLLRSCRGTDNETHLPHNTS